VQKRHLSEVTFFFKRNMQDFFKYQGTGNDFVMVDNRTKQQTYGQVQIEKICDRRFGIGADGFILIENHPDFDFKMVYYNSDGRESTMCGNGGRCAVKFAKDLGIFENQTNFIAIDGPHTATVASDGTVHLGMIPVSEIETTTDGLFLNTGSPHLIIFTNNVISINVKEEGAKLRYSDFWKARGGVNVNFVQVISDNSISVRTYERGVEDETYSCGTGVTAAAIASYFSQKINSMHIDIKTLGGNLQVGFESINKLTFKNIDLCGPALFVFKGVF
jgi:diaminopimelate epimerase